MGIIAIPIFQLEKLSFKARKWKIQDQNLPSRISPEAMQQVSPDLGFSCTNTSANVKGMGQMGEAGNFNGGINSCGSGGDSKGR